MSGVGVKFSTRVVDHGGDKLFNQTIKKLASGDPQVKVGVFASEKSGGEERDGLTNVEIAAIHEFGTDTIPERSFIRQTFEANKRKYAEMIRKLLPKVVEGEHDVVWMFDIVGQQIVADINAFVRESQGPGFALEPLKPETIARKGSDRPLIDTGRMLAAVTWVTVMSGREASP